MARPEEEKSYAHIFLFSSIVLIGVFVWLVVDESILSRPWKGYQREFYQLEKDYLIDKIEKEREAFEGSERYKKYQDLKSELARAEVILNSSETQERLKGLKLEQSRLIKKELAPVSTELIAARNKKLEVEYIYGKYLEKREKALKQIKELEQRIKELEYKEGELIRKKDLLTQKIALITADVNRLTAELSVYTAEIDSFQTRLASVRRKRPTLQVYQVHIPDIGMVDRCQSCHVGINKSEGISDKNPYKGHPNRDLYLGKHPPDEFGCVLCHEGQGRALTSVEEAHGEVEYWLTPLLRGDTVESSCAKCHDINSPIKGAPVLTKGRELFTKLGCYRCHVTKGFEGLEKMERTGPDLLNIAYTTQPEWLIRWIQNPKHVRPETGMPNFNFTREEAEAIGSYLWQASERTSQISETESPIDNKRVEEGKDLFQSKGCYACHKDGEKGGDLAPNLIHIGEKLNYDYAVEWLLAPKKYQPKTVMPSFRLNDNEARSIAAYLVTLKEMDITPSIDKVLSDPEKAKMGGELIKRYGCFSCHNIKGMEDIGRIGVELTTVGSKEIHFFDFGLFKHEILHGVGLKRAEYNVAKARLAWIATKLKEPRIFDEGRYKLPQDRLRMPNFGLKDDEIHSLVIFLAGLQEVETPERFKYKPTQDQRDLFDGWKMVKKYNCIGCHQFSLDRIELKDGARLEGEIKKEKKGDIFFQLWQDCPDLGKKAGQNVKFKRDEIKIHEPGIGGDIAPLLVANLVQIHGIEEKEAINFIPPKLYGQGRKTQSNWLFGFLKKPIILRPWYKAVMPTFGMTDEEAQKIAKYFAIRDNASYPFDFIKEKDKEYLTIKEKETPGYLKKAKALFTSATVNCISCHIEGDIMPEGKPSDWAPDISIAKERLRPNWITNWLSDPQSVQPGTKMPTFFSQGMYQELLPGDPTYQIEAIKDFLMNYPSKTSEFLASHPDMAVNY